MEGRFQDSSPAAAVRRSIIGLLLDLSMSMTDRNVRPTRFDLMLEYLPVCLSFLSLPPSPYFRFPFPLYRSWMLADACRADVAHFLLTGHAWSCAVCSSCAPSSTRTKSTTSILGYGSTTSVAGYKLVRGMWLRCGSTNTLT